VLDNFVFLDVISISEGFSNRLAVEAREESTSENTSGKAKTNRDEVGSDVVSGHVVTRLEEVIETGSVEFAIVVGSSNGNHVTNASNSSSSGVGRVDVGRVQKLSREELGSDRADVDIGGEGSNEASTSSSSGTRDNSNGGGHDNTTSKGSVEDFLNFPLSIVVQGREAECGESSRGGGQESVDNNTVLEQGVDQSGIVGGEVGDDDEGTEDREQSRFEGGLDVLLSFRDVLADEEHETNAEEGTENVNVDGMFVGQNVQLVVDDVLVQSITNALEESNEDHLNSRDLAKNATEGNQDGGGSVAGTNEGLDGDDEVRIPVTRVDANPEFVDKESPLEGDTSDEEDVEERGDSGSLVEGVEKTITNKGHSDDVDVEQVFRHGEGDSIGESVGGSVGGIVGDSSEENDETNLEDNEDEEESLSGLSFRAGRGSRGGHRSGLGGRSLGFVSLLEKWHCCYLL